MNPGGRRVFRAIGRLMHRIARPAVHVKRLSRHGRMAWWEVNSQYRNRNILRKAARHGATEFLKLLLALTVLPRAYRALDRWRRRDDKPRLDALDPRTQEAVRHFLSRLDEASLPPLSRVFLYGSRARGDYRDDSDVDIALVFAGARPDVCKQEDVWIALEVVQWSAYVDMKKPVEITPFAYWQDEFDEPDTQYNPDFFRNVLADGIEVREA